MAPAAAAGTGMCGAGMLQCMQLHNLAKLRHTCSHSAPDACFLTKSYLGLLVPQASYFPHAPLSPPPHPSQAPTCAPPS